MRIPLDYYRILGLPIQASAEQLQQAYRDRILQLPRREYSEIAIAARKQLLDEAYAVLSDLEQRRSYDATFLAKTYEPKTEEQAEALPGGTAASVTPGFDKSAPSIEIKDSEFVGALLILQELGEYELVLKLGRSHLNNGDVDIENGRFGEPRIVRQDIVLTVAQASLELGREQWKQRRYENAAETLTTGKELVLREGVFPAVRRELQADLFKLRPYRILELLALPLENEEPRHQGFQLLREMLQERGGIDGNGDDESGLNVDDFLRFIQQLRGYMTVAEQQALFEQEARRPSAVATYLAVYALMAGGFVERQPASIRRGKMMLTRLLKRQDVHLEMAVCALLLGQTEEASQALELSGEYQSLAFIREHSQGDPDLLPGLCLYSERWLQSEVFPHFRDLANHEVSLKEYFADEQLQTSLEALPPEAEGINDWEAVASARLSLAVTQPRSLGEAASSMPSERQSFSFLANQSQGTQAGSTESKGLPDPKRTAAGSTSSPRERAKAGVSATSTGASLDSSGYNVQTLPAAERVVQGASGAESVAPTISPEDTGVEGVRAPGQSFPDSTAAPGESQPPSRTFPLRVGGRRGQRAGRWPKLNLRNLLPLQYSRRSGTLKQPQLIALGVIGLLGIIISLIILSWIVNALSSKPAQQVQQPVEQVEPSPVATPEPDTALLSSSGPMTEAVAKQAIETWLDTKAKAFGPDRAVDELKNILANPALSRTQNLARTAQTRNVYRKYEHSIKDGSIKIIRTTNDRARVEAVVSESAQQFQGDKLISKESYNSPNLRVRYEMVRQNGQWQIQDMTVLRK